MTDTLITARLTLVPLSLDVVEALYEIFRAPENVTYWYAEAHKSPEESRAMIEHNLIAATWSPWWVVTLTGTAQMIGILGFYIGGPVPGMGYILHRDFWRQGYATEAVNTVLEYGFTRLNLNRVELWIHEANAASQALAAKTGFQRRGQFYMPASEHLPAHETLVYGLRAVDWAARQPNPPSVAPCELPVAGIYATLATRDVAATVAFYHDKLGFHVNYVGEEDPPHFAIVSRGEWRTQRSELHFVYRQELGVSTGWLTIRVGLNIDALYEEFRRKDVTIVDEIATQGYGSREFAILDNNGWRLVFSSPVSS